MAQPIRPKDLPTGTTTDVSALVVDNGSVVIRATPRDVMNAGRPVATQGDAETGADNEKLMTPLRVRQAMDALPIAPGKVEADSLTNDPTELAAITDKLKVIGSYVGEVFRSITDWYNDRVTPERFGAVGDDNADDTAALQAALNTGRKIHLRKKYKVTAKLTASSTLSLTGEVQGTAQIRGTHAGVILEIPGGTENPEVHNINFRGSGCTAIATSDSGGVLGNYLVRAHFTGNRFWDELTFGVDSNLIYCVIERNKFGYDYEGSRTGGGRLRSAGDNPLYTNRNIIRENMFFCGTASNAALDISAGDNWIIEANGFEQGGAALRVSNVNRVSIRHNWFEAMTVGTSQGGGNALLQFGAMSTPAEIAFNDFTNNTCYAVISFSGGDTPATMGLDIHHNSIAKTGASLTLFDTVTLATTLPALGNISFYENGVSGGSGSDKFVSGTDFRGGPTSPRIVASVDTTGSGSLLFCSDPGATLSRNGTGDVTITNISHPLATGTDKVMPVLSPRGGTEARAQVTNTSSVRVQAFNSSGTGVDGIIGVAVYGA